VNLICKLFGHRPRFGYASIEGAGYFKVKSTVTDGIGRVHASLITECHRCGVVYQVGMLHLPQQRIEVETGVGVVHIGTSQGTPTPAWILRSSTHDSWEEV
jgi:hypothetical protein